MQVYNGLDATPAMNTATAVTIGVFDGVHRGHQAIIKRTVELAKTISGSSVVITFDKHPLSVIRPEAMPPLLTAIDLKTEYIEGLGVDVLIILPFSKEIANVEPEAFVDETLAGMLRAKYLIVGEDFSFGKDRRGSIEFLRRYGDSKGIMIEVIPHLKSGDVTISSTEIRDRLRSGDVKGASELIGRLPRFRGTVVHGFGRGGSLIGIPTANVHTLYGEMLPKPGVYAGYVTVENNRLPGVIDIGVSPTFGDVADAEIQVHIIGYKGNLYGKNIDVELVARLRGEKRFESANALAKQIRSDIEEAKQTLAVTTTGQS